MNYPWYSEIDNLEPLEQGDIVSKCSILVPEQDHYLAIINPDENIESRPIGVIEITAIIVSQSCDIINEKIDSIIVCPIWPLSDLIKADEYFKGSKAREELRKGLSPSYHLLNRLKSEQLVDDFYFVDFKHIYSVPKKFLEIIVLSTKRKRLLPPYREHLSQAFARYFMRVGLPTDINPDEIRNYHYKTGV